jgi:hypothetical protein
VSALKRTDGSPVTRSRRLAIREWGIAYRPRGPRRRSRRSSWRARESHTGRRAAGDVMPPAARYARCGAPTLSEVSTESSAYITGKRCDAKVSRTVWREADGKGLHQEHLAGGPPYPMSSGGSAHSSVARLASDAITSHEIAFLPWYALRDGRCPMRALKGMSGAPTSCSIRSSVTEHGRAYKTRVSWSRSSRSTQSDCCNGRTQTDRKVCRWLVDHRKGDPVRGRAGEGEQVAR